ncbi:MAG: homoserine dehydrogenase [Verrucomicrobiales bacterium]|nr:homoserine dehydrogenase [Verrucomicrobiales bacterium]
MADSTNNSSLKIGLAGFGNVGAGVYKNLLKNGELLQQRTGKKLEIHRIVVRDLDKKREIDLPNERVSTDLNDLITDEELDIVVELIGGTDLAFDLVKSALEKGKSVVTGNKALLAEHGKELFAIADRENTPIYFEAAVAGGIPIIKTVQESLVGNNIESMAGIINGTSNYILGRMSDAGLGYEEALAEAQQLGYAESDPALDVNGWDAAHKAIILASLSYGSWVRSEDIFVEGIEKISLADIRVARDLGYVIKLLAIIQLDADSGNIEVRVQPSLIPKTHILASVDGVFNAIFVRGDIVGETLFYGSGAGQDPTSSSVISDLADAAAHLNGAAASRTGFVPHGLYGQPLPVDDSVSQYYLRLSVADQPGVMARISSILGEHQIGISSMIQPEEHDDGLASIFLMLYFAPFGTMKKAVAQIAKLDCIQGEPILMRVESL